MQSVWKTSYHRAPDSRPHSQSGSCNSKISIKRWRDCFAQCDKNGHTETNMDRFRCCSGPVSLVQACGITSWPDSGIPTHSVQTEMVNRSLVKIASPHTLIKRPYLLIFLHRPDQWKTVDDPGNHRHQSHFRRNKILVFYTPVRFKIKH